MGPRPRHDDLPDEVDVYAGDADHFWSKLRGGDDFVQWTLRLGCVLFDDGIFRAGTKAIATENLWPDPKAQLSRLPDQRELALRLIRMGDRDAAQDQVRAVLTSGARAPFGEARLPAREKRASRPTPTPRVRRVAEALSVTIHAERSLAELEGDLACLRRYLPSSP